MKSKDGSDLLAQFAAGFVARLSSQPMTRIVAFGSSNTERAGHSDGRCNWFDWLDLAVRQRHGRVHHAINAGVCGETTRQLLGRFDRDVAHYAPHVVLVTIGGNDSNPAHAMAAVEFRANLGRLVERLQGLPDCAPVLQTYYACDLERMDPVHSDRFTRYMRIVRELGAETRTPVVDHLARWERLRRTDVEAYRRLMRDPMHVTPVGNLLWGLDLARALGVSLAADAVPGLAEGFAAQTRLDALERAGMQ